MSSISRKKQKAFNKGKHELLYWMNCKPVYEVNEAAFVCYSKIEYLSLGPRINRNANFGSRGYFTPSLNLNRFMRLTSRLKA